jgi:uncharacterized protein (DUF488 family)
MAIYSIGHSTRSIEDFLSLLQRYNLKNLVDVRRFPYSPRNPQFNIDNLQKSLTDTGIGYFHLEKLAGRRNPFPDSHNSGLRNKGFRGYADYMGTDEFKEGIGELLKIERQGNAAFMCAEAVPWRCHRNLLSDFLTVKGIAVMEIISDAEPKLHKFNSMAVWEDQKLIYPKSGQKEFDFH